MSKMMLCQPKFVLMTLAIILCYNQHLGSANPLPEDTVSTVTGKASDFIDRFKNTVSPDKDKPDGPKLTTWEIIGIAAAAVVVFFFLLCCIGYCLCECVKELICCICCCCRD